MSYTYTQEIAAPEADTTFVPSYARKSVKPKKVKTWMVLAPIAGLALIGGAAAMLMNSGGEVQPLAEPAAAPAAVSQPAPLSSTPVATPSAMTSTATPAAPVAAAPIARVETPVAPAARRAEPAQVRRAAPAPTVTPRIETPVQAAGPRAYEAAPAAPAATTTPATATATPAPAPVIVVAPLN